MGVPSRLVAAAFLGLVQENLSLVTIEIIGYLLVFLLLLHIHSSGRRNATMFVAATLVVGLVELLFFRGKRWHAQALVMLVPETLPVYNVLMQALFYYMAFVATSRLRIDPFIQPFAMGALLVALVFPFELLGAKFLWWTWHDTDPLLITRVYGVPVHALFYHFFFGFAFNAAHHTLRSLWLIGAYYEEEHWKREWTYVALMPIASAFYAVVFLILGYHAVVQLLKVDPTAAFVLNFGLGVILTFMADREKDEPHVERLLDPVDAYDSDWLYVCIDHAVNQMVCVYTVILSVLVLMIQPADIVSVGHHQPLGNCLEQESIWSLLGTSHKRRRFLCVQEFDEEFNLCNYPVAQLHYEESWYMICGRGYNNFPTYAALVLGGGLLLNLLFYQVLKRPKRARVVSFQKRHL